ncbi:YncE family protein [Arthrobacter glacialis]|uniref:Gram-positive cocci surface proteins LPxTG domain-containing protein n=1 Tax=Arthrobacter glacialis TaxID=1664 RepID=A0A2S3ZXR8_ARTGL|nr:YncE family protein [Arthrobacter glacialis]POH73998.1 hypothetical protein CVS27_08860 [Arthrobacter glacialis]
MRTRRLSLPRFSALAVAGAVVLAALVPLPAQAAPSTYELTKTISVGSDPTSVAVDATRNKTYVANTTSNTVSVIDTVTGTVVSSFPALLPPSGQPVAIALNTVTNSLYLANPNGNTVVEFNAATGLATGSFQVDSFPYAMAVNETTNKTYIANTGGSISVIDGGTRTVAILPTGPGTTPSAVAVNETTNTIYAVDYNSSRLFEINGVTNAIKAGVPVGMTPFGVAVNETTNMVYTTSLGQDTVTVFDGANRTVVGSIAVGLDPFEVQVDEGRNTVFVANSTGNSVSVVDGATNTVASTVALGSNTRSIALNTATNTVYATRADNKLAVIIEMSPPVVTTTSLASATVGTAYSATIAATGSGPITFAVTTGSLPTGLTLNTTTGAITGTPSTAGDATFTITATNAAGSNAKAFTITTVQAPTITTEDLVGATVDEAYSATIAATGTPPLTFTVSTGELPAGLSLDAATGAITGTPTAAGSVEFTITATNVAGSNAKEFTITTSLTPAITTESLAGATVGTAYSAKLEATGTAPLTFTVSAGELPAGLTLDAATGTIAGTSTAAGSAEFTITATNVAGSNAKEFTLVTSPTPAITIPTPAATVKPSPAAPLAKTGIDALPWLAGSGIVLLAGAMLILLTTARRRRSA